jgi:fido (protein-threonine AMPylation protein)
MNDTELRLAHWRGGSTQAERLAAALLAQAGYGEIDQQHPLGGPDGKKDLVCTKGGVSWVGAVYFPTAPQRFATTKAKFKSDLEGVTDDHGGIVFVTNQSLTQRQRKSLIELAEAAGKNAEIFHLERLLHLLESAPGYGTRLQFLRIPMTLEDQLAWFDDAGNRVATALTSNTREVLAVRAMVERLSAGQKEIVRTIKLATPGKPNALGPVPFATPDLLSVSSFMKADDLPPVTASLTPGMVLLFHRLICFDLPTKSVGSLRTLEVALSAADGSKAEHIQPTAAKEVAEELKKLCQDWSANFVTVARTSVDERLAKIAAFHSKFLVIHPFMDGNGRVARGLLMQQCLDFFGRADMSLMDKGAGYYRALAEADAGRLGPLTALLQPIVQS